MPVEERTKRQWKSFKKYCQRLGRCKAYLSLDGWSRDKLLSYWAQRIAIGKSTPEYAYNRLLVLRVWRTDRGLTVTAIPKFEEFLKGKENKE